VRSSRWMPAVWSGIYFLLLLSLFTPLNMITICFVMIPPVVLYVLAGRRLFALFFAVPLALIVALLKDLGWLLALFSLGFLIPAVVMGEMYVRSKPARQVVMGGIAALVGEMLLLLMALYSMGVKVNQEIRQYFLNGYETLPEAMKSVITPETLEMTANTAIQMIPFFMIATGMFYAVVTHLIGGGLLRAMGVQVPRFAPIREWMLPRSLVWYYLILILMDLFMSKNSSSIWTALLVNALPLLTLLFGVQAVSFAAYYVHVKQRLRAFPFITAILFPVLPQIVCLLGVFDVAFPLRSAMNKR